MTMVNVSVGHYILDDWGISQIPLRGTELDSGNLVHTKYCSYFGDGGSSLEAIHGRAHPHPQAQRAKQRPFVRLVDRILAAKAADADADTEPLEWEIDRLVYDLYGLTEGETTAVERSLGLIHATDEEEDTALLRAMDEGDINDRVSMEEVLSILRAPDEC